MQHYKRDKTSNQTACDVPAERELLSACDDESPAAKADPAKRVFLTLETQCSGASPGTSQQNAQVTLQALDECIEVEALGNNTFGIRLRSCGQNADFDSCGIRIENGFVRQFAKPVMSVSSTDGTIGVTPTACGVNLSVATTMDGALPWRLLNDLSCSNSVRALGIVRVVKVPAGYQVQGAAIASGTGIATLAIPNTTYSTLAEAVTAMDAAAATFTVDCNDSGGGGP